MILRLFIVGIISVVGSGGGVEISVGGGGMDLMKNCWWRQRIQSGVGGANGFKVSLVVAVDSKILIKLSETKTFGGVMHRVMRPQGADRFRRGHMLPRPPHHLRVPARKHII